MLFKLFLFFSFSIGEASNTMNFFLGIVFSMSQYFGLLCSNLHFLQGIFRFIYSLFSLLTHSMFNNMLLSFHLFVCFSVFFLWLICSFIALWSEKMLAMISTFFNLLRNVLCPKMWSTLENISCALEKYLFCCFGLKCFEDIN